MASLSDVYGDNYSCEVKQSRVDHVVNVLVKNISARNYDFRFDSSSVWTGNNINDSAKKALLFRIKKICNKQCLFEYIDKRDPSQLPMLPNLINGPVEYFYTIDFDKVEIHFIFITPDAVTVLCGSCDPK